MLLVGAVIGVNARVEFECCVPPARRLVWANLYAPWVMHRERFDRYHAEDNLSLPLFWPKGRTRYALTPTPLLFQVSIRRLIRIADAIGVASESTKGAILERF